MHKYRPNLLVEFVRNGLVEQCHYGIVLKINSDGSFYNIGDDFNYPFYLRSCAKPLQASLIIDLGIDNLYSMTSEEIAVCCASHTGEDCHIKVIKSLMKKFDLSENLYKCGIHKPLSKTKQDEMLKFNEKISVLHNNCSGKHTMMLALCKKMDWNTKNYDAIEHPLQQAIQKNIFTLCELNETYPITKDGCGVPIFSMPLKNMLKGYINLFSNRKYEKIKNAFLDNPYLIGGEDRLDSAIISASDFLVAKVGAGGLCIVVNTKINEAILVKIMDCDMKARAIVTIEALKQLDWLSNENEYIKNQNAKEILTLHKEKLGEANICFSMN